MDTKEWDRRYKSERTAGKLKNENGGTERLGAIENEQKKLQEV